MTKIKTPLLSLRASGPLGNVLSFDNRSGTPRVRKMPKPKDAYTLAQAYHRWDYQDYVALWNAQSDATKQQWETDARRSHMTGFAYWMQYYLSTLPDLRLRLHLDESGGQIARDSSKKDNHGTVYGTNILSGIISNCRWFDGINDYITTPSIQMNGNRTILLWICPNFAYDDGLSYGFFYWFKAANNRLGIFKYLNDRIYVYGATPTGNFNPNALITFSPGDWLHIAATLNLTDNQSKIYVNSVLKLTDLRPDHTADTAPLNIGKPSYFGDRYFLGKIDEVRIYNRVLSQSEIQRHYERRYPEL